MADRKTSPLADADTAPWDDSATRGDQQKSSKAAEAETAPEPRSGAVRAFPATSRRKRSGTPLDPFDKVSANFNLPLVIRRLARMLAARRECDTQDIVTEALLEKFEREGIEVPTTRAEYDRLVRDGKL